MPELITEGKIFRPRSGFPFKQLPAGGITPESMINEQTRIGRQQIQQRFNLAWNEINRSARFIGRVKAGHMRQELHTKAKQEMLQFNQQAQAQMAQIQSINRLAEQGFISPEDAARVNAGRVFGTDVANRMYPTPEKGQTPQQVMGELNRYKEIIQSNLDRYRSVRIPEFWKGKAKERYKTQFLDYNLPSEKEGEVGAWRDVTEEDIQNQKLWKQELKEVKEFEMEIAGIPGIKHRIVQPGTTGGTFSDQVAESYKKPVRQRPRPTRQQPGTIPEPRSEQEYNALPPGTRYRHPAGDIRIKK